MKNIKKYSFLHIKSVIVCIALFSIMSCTDFLDVDKDTDNPTEAPIDQLLPGVQLGIKNINEFNSYSSNVLSVYTHQFCARADHDQYGAKPSSVPMRREWNNIYLTLTNIETLISNAEKENNKVYVGIAQILKAYMMSVAVDLWGDVPYSEATQLESGIVSPIYDNQKIIYQNVLDLISLGKANVNSGVGLKMPSDDDLFYKGDLDKWIRFANTYKFKLYNQIRGSSIFNSTDFNSLITENNFFASSADDFQFNYTATTSPSDERNRLYLRSYGGTQVSHYLSPWFYEILKGMNPNIHNTNADPRLPYYIVNQLQAGVLPPDQGDAGTGDPHADYWDSSTGFFSIRFGSIGPNRDHGVQNSASFPGIFICGGLYDESSGYSININSATGVAPHRILTYDEFLYIQAELMHAGVLTGAGATVDKLEEAMIASFAKVDEVVISSGSSQAIPILSGSASVTTFIANVIAEFTAGDANKKLEIIMTQKWVATFGDSMDQYSDYRRTGFPILANPNGSSPEYQLDNGDGFPLDDGVTVLNNSFQNSIFWPQQAINLNQNAPSQKNPSTYLIFWDN